MIALIIDAPREGYNPKQVHSTLTVGQLMDVLSEYDSDTKIYTSHDGGYTYGGIHYDGIEDQVFNEDE